MADDIDDILRVVLQLASLLQVTGLPGIDDAHETTAIVVRSAADATLSTAHGEAREDGLVLTVEHVELSVLVATAAVVLVEALEGVLDASEVGNAPIDSLQEVEHREEGAVEGGDVIEVEGELRRTAGYLLAVLDQFLNAAHLGEGRRHRTDTEGTDGLGVFGKILGTANTGAAYMHDDLEVREILHGSHPRLGDLLALVLGEHIALATGAVDKHTFQTVAIEQCGIFGDDTEVDAAICVHRGERGVNKTFDFFHCVELV